MQEAELTDADSEVTDDNLAADQQVNARVPKGMEELVPDMIPETISEGVREITLPNDPVEVDTEAWEADEIKELETDSLTRDAEDHVEQDEQMPIGSEDAGQTEDAHLQTVISEAEEVDKPEERAPEAVKGPDVLETTAEPEEERQPAKKKLGDTMPLDVALRKLLHPELEELTADDFQDETAPMDFNFEDEEEPEFDLTETGAMDFNIEDEDDSGFDLTETGAMDFNVEDEDDSEFDLTETGAMDFDIEKDDDSEFDLTETGAMDFNIEDEDDSEFDLTETGAMDFDFEDEEESEFGGEKDMGNTSQIKFRPVRKDEIDDEEDLADLEQAIGEIESVADIDMVSRVKEEKTSGCITRGRRSGKSRS